MLNKIKVWYSRIIRSRTMWLSIIVSVLGVLQASTEVISTILSPVAAGIVTLGVGIAFAILRVDTTKALQDK